MKYEELQKEMINAMKAKDKPRKEAISSIIATAKRMAIDEGSRENIGEELVLKAIMKELKSAKEQLDTCPPERTDLLDEYSIKYNVVKEFAPVMMSEAEVERFLLENFAEFISTKNKGMLMKNATAQLRGKADGKLINNVATRLCQ